MAMPRLVSSQSGRVPILWAAAAIAVLAASCCVAQNTSWSQGRARLFVADNTPASPGVVVVDLPSGNISGRIAMPGTSLQLGASQDNAHVGVFRNRDNDQHFLTVISTGIRPIVPVTVKSSTLRQPAALKEGEVGPMRRPVLAKSFLLVNGSDGIGGVETGGMLVYHGGWKQYLAYAENHGTVYTYQSESLHGSRRFEVRSTMKLPVGHFHVLPYGNHIIAPHTGVSRAYILDSRGRQVGSYPCGGCHGSAAYEKPGHLAAVFGCNDSVLVVHGTERTGHYLPATSPRVGSFVYGAPGVFWSSNTLQTFFWRTDVRGEEPGLTRVAHRGGLLRLVGLEGAGGHLLGLHIDGNITMYHGDTGAEVVSLQLEPAGYANQTAPQLLFDAAHSHLFVSVARTATVHAVEIKMAQPASAATAGAVELRVVRSVVVGGMPGAMALAYMPGVAPPPSSHSS
ncbi:hypothetical protein CHLRE_07g352000v5 [Chlamydomonas reinhardtii]|uniref:Uncharacterized protein n=1 Tax=Chlamydomonas reinhardtii TaxID=3055 RepID=A0A2K3DLE7_CHLRE|nr:uncharacterized protein CHLRE_07g352000v5 [Chlamydomonas reinhardtii]PNW81343.1 hypothetical protein CHLRE_07g352000v5 [Chlamydomonas reinhardtii]